MTMELIGTQQQTRFTFVGWSFVIELALKNGWKPAGALEPVAQDGEAIEVLAFDDEQSRPLELPPDHPLAPMVQSRRFQSDDPVLNSYFANAGFRVSAQDAKALGDALAVR